MSLRKTVFALVLATGVLPALANSGSTFVGADVGTVKIHPMPSTKPRVEVMNELIEFRKNPITHDGVRVVGGDVGYLPAQHAYAFRDGQLVHTDILAHSAPKARVAMTAEERKLYQELYSSN